MSQTSAFQARDSPARVRERRRPPGPVAQLALELALEFRRMQVLPDARLQPLERGHQDLGDEAPAERTEAAALVRKLARERGVAQAAQVVERRHRAHARHRLAADARADDELADAAHILDARRALDAARHVHAEGPHRRDGTADRHAVEPTAENQFAGAREHGGRRPVCDARRCR